MTTIMSPYYNQINEKNIYYYIKLSLSQSQQAVHDLVQGKLETFDGTCGDNACEIRAYFVLDNLKPLLEEAKRVKDRIEENLLLLNRTHNQKAPLDITQFDISISSSFRHLLDNHLLYNVREKPGEPKLNPGLLQKFSKSVPLTVRNTVVTLAKERLGSFTLDYCYANLASTSKAAVCTSILQHLKEQKQLVALVGQTQFRFFRGDPDSLEFIPVPLSSVTSSETCYVIEGIETEELTTHLEACVLANCQNNQLLPFTIRHIYATTLSQ